MEETWDLHIDAHPPRLIEGHYLSVLLFITNYSGVNAIPSADLYQHRWSACAQMAFFPCYESSDFSLIRICFVRSVGSQFISIQHYACADSEAELYIDRTLMKRKQKPVCYYTDEQSTNSTCYIQTVKYRIFN